MSAPSERSVLVNGQPCRIWEKGSGEPLGVLLGVASGLAWTPFLEELSQTRRVIVPSLPGFPGALGHDLLDSHLDWIAATLDLLEEAGLGGADLAGTSAGATLAAEVAIFAPGFVRRLALVAPFGLFEESEPVADMFAVPPGNTSLLVSEGSVLGPLMTPPEGEAQIEFQVTAARMMEAAARLLWPTTDTGVAKRLHRIECPTLVVWGSEDRVVPASYAKRFADAVGGPVGVRSIEGAGHLAELDAPSAVAAAILEFLV